jgi:hypothetical protein
LTAKELIARLPLVDTNILDEAAKQPGLFSDAALHRVEKMRKRSEAISSLDYFHAKLALHIRASKNEKGEKITEGALKERIEINKTHRALRAAMERAYEEEEFAKLLLEVLRQRRDGIRIIADARLHDMTPNEVERSVRRKIAGDARKLTNSRWGQQANQDDED